LSPSKILGEQKNQNTLLEQNKYELTKVPELPQQPNHNDCFIEAHNKILDKEQAANKCINCMGKERTTMVNQLNRMIKIDTVHENTKNKNNDIGYAITENNNNEIISTEKLQVTCERSNTETEDIKHQVPETRRVVQELQVKNDTKLHPTDTIQDKEKLSIPVDDEEINQSVPGTRRIVQKTMLKEEANSTPMDTTGSLRENIGVQPNAQNIDTRLLLGSEDILTVIFA
jgi:hypothetical protein